MIKYLLLAACLTVFINSGTSTYISNVTPGVKYNTAEEAIAAALARTSSGSQQGSQLNQAVAAGQAESAANFINPNTPNIKKSVVLENQATASSAASSRTQVKNGDETITLYTPPGVSTVILPNTEDETIVLPEVPGQTTIIDIIENPDGTTSVVYPGQIGAGSVATSGAVATSNGQASAASNAQAASAANAEAIALANAEAIALANAEAKALGNAQAAAAAQTQAATASNGKAAAAANAAATSNVQAVSTPEAQTQTVGTSKAANTIQTQGGATSAAEATSTAAGTPTAGGATQKQAVAISAAQVSQAATVAVASTQPETGATSQIQATVASDAVDTIQNQPGDQATMASAAVATTQPGNQAAAGSAAVATTQNQPKDQTAVAYVVATTQNQPGSQAGAASAAVASTQSGNQAAAESAAVATTQPGNQAAAGSAAVATTQPGNQAAAGSAAVATTQPGNEAAAGSAAVATTQSGNQAAVGSAAVATTQNQPKDQTAAASAVATTKNQPGDQAGAASAAVATTQPGDQAGAASAAVATTQSGNQAAAGSAAVATTQNQPKDQTAAASVVATTQNQPGDQAGAASAAVATTQSGNQAAARSAAVATTQNQPKDQTAAASVVATTQNQPGDQAGAASAAVATTQSGSQAAAGSAAVATTQNQPGDQAGAASAAVATTQPGDQAGAASAAVATTQSGNQAAAGSAAVATTQNQPKDQTAAASVVATTQNQPGDQAGAASAAVATTQSGSQAAAGSVAVATTQNQPGDQAGAASAAVATTQPGDQAGAASAAVATTQSGNQAAAGSAAVATTQNQPKDQTAAASVVATTQNQPGDQAGAASAAVATTQSGNQAAARSAAVATTQNQPRDQTAAASVVATTQNQPGDQAGAASAAVATTQPGDQAGAASAAVATTQPGDQAGAASAAVAKTQSGNQAAAGSAAVATTQNQPKDQTAAESVVATTQNQPGDQAGAASAAVATTQPGDQAGAASAAVATTQNQPRDQTAAASVVATTQNQPGDQAGAASAAVATTQPGDQAGAASAAVATTQPGDQAGAASAAVAKTQSGNQAAAGSAAVAKTQNQPGNQASASSKSAATAQTQSGNQAAAASESVATTSSQPGDQAGATGTSSATTTATPSATATATATAVAGSKSKTEPPCFIECSSNETYSTSVNSGCLGATYCSEIGAPVKCVNPKFYYQGCICKKGYLRDDITGYCVLEKDCPRPVVSCAGDINAQPGCGINCGRHCSDYQLQLIDPNYIAQCIQICYEGGCDCKPGFLFDDVIGKCVTPSNCTKCIGQNEFYDPCPGCSTQTCASLGSNEPCPIGPAVCKPACRCLKGFYRNQYGICVPEADCPCRIGETFLASDGCNTCSCLNGRRGSAICTLKACGPDPKCEENEVLSECFNGGCWDARYCSEIGNPTICVKPQYCEKGCLCVEGYVRDDSTGKCIPRKECPEPCPLNEVHDTCPPQCLQETCASLSDTDIECPIRPQVCEPACRCQTNFYRNSSGSCIPREQCPESCNNTNHNTCNGDPNAQPGCGINCGRWCSNYDSTEPVYCIQVCYDNACDCKEGYVFDEVIGQCVLPPECSKYKCTQPHEIYDPCTDCSPQTCETIFEPNCPWDPTIQCQGQCRCEPGYYKNKIGECISKENCLKCQQPHEYYSCGGACDNVCKDLSIQNQTACPIINIKCNEMCYCEEGFARDDRNICIPIEKCPVIAESCDGDPNAQPGCGINCGRLCSNYDSTEPIFCTLQCYDNACDCKEGYVFDEVIGQCVLPKECSKYKCTQPHEIYDPCPDCSPQTCETIFDPTCPWDTTRHCQGQCRCEPGYYRNKIGECISKDNCLKCQQPHEYYSCGGACDNVCKDLSIQNQTACPIINIKCNEMCYCEEGFARDDRNICIPIEKCPVIANPICGKQEILDSCFNGGCFGARKCTEIGRPIICIDLLEGYCKKGCVCIEGYLKDKHGICIPEHQCPHKASKCRGKHEEYSTCTNGGCLRAQRCSQRGQPEVCVDIPPQLCKPGCLCLPEYLRNYNGDCVPEHKCTVFKDGNDNDDWDTLD